ncbi:MAG TPA: hypothetical protein VHZ24_06225 [Pirellulales bacterium]|jgi:uncharacterized membrane protein|nr:hypothetical protein [Pirellulales bacterium]
MNETLAQRGINDAEWRNPDNWSGIWMYRVYFSKRDSRIWVPATRLGPFGPSTINVGHRYDFLVMALLFYAMIAMSICIGWVVAQGG